MPASHALLDTRRAIVHSTIDARLQRACRGDPRRPCARSRRGGKAAAVVLDPDTGDVLAVASYPIPSSVSSAIGHGERRRADALLDRARYGLYPPGSTFKLVTAAAALRQDNDVGPQHVHVHACCRTAASAPDSRLGRPSATMCWIRTPHGTIGMHDGIVAFVQRVFRATRRACRAGGAFWRPRRGSASRSAPSNSVERLRATLPQAGYGQGDVVATPLRMARVAAAIASDGVLRDAASGYGGASVMKPERSCRADAAPTAGALHARRRAHRHRPQSQRSIPWRIAGKTGTAEVSGAPSHAWFVGFAPYGGDQRGKSPSPCIVENAGYGGLAAAPVAGEIVTAAAAAGLIK